MRKIYYISSGSVKAVVCMKMNTAMKEFTQKLQWKVSDGYKPLICELRMK
jgi:hypothetical protein